MLNRVFAWHGWPTVIAATTSFAAIAALYFTSQTLGANSNQYHLAQRGQASERFGKAVEHLGSGQLEMRHGGIYSLEQLARDSAQDQESAFEVISAFIRTHAHRNERCVRDTAALGGFGSTIPFDVQVAMTVVGRRVNPEKDINVDLNRTCLIGLDGRNFAPGWNADLSGADMTRAFMMNADLAGALMYGTNLTDAYMFGVNLTDANLTDANLTDANLTDANLTGADLSMADLSSANLTETDLSDIRYNDQTQWPAGFQPPPSK